MSDEEGAIRLSAPAHLLFLDWVGKLLDEEFGATGYGGAEDARTITLRDESRVTITLREEPDKSFVAAVSHPSHDLRELATDAATRSLRNQFGDGTWFRLSLSCDVGLEAASVHFMRILGEHKRFQGDWAFANDCLLTFDQAKVEPAPVVMPNFSLAAVFRVPSPWWGPFGRQKAEELATLIRCAAAFASGAGFQPLAALRPVSEEDAQDAQDKLKAGVSLLYIEDVMLGPALLRLIHPRGREAFERALGALYSYEQAISQQSSFVAVILFVTALEALFVPAAAWRKRRVTKRFSEGLLHLADPKLQEILQHANVAQAFGDIRSARALVEELYEVRSRPLHTGFVPHAVTTLPDLGGKGSLQVALLSDIVRYSILSFLRTPFSSLYGHPDIDPEPEK